MCAEADFLCPFTLETVFDLDFLPKETVLRRSRREEANDLWDSFALRGTFENRTSSSRSTTTPESTTESRFSASASRGRCSVVGDNKSSSEWEAGASVTDVAASEVSAVMSSSTTPVVEPER